MNIYGGGKMLVYPPADELPHTPGPEENWQESFVLIWYDLKQSVGGFFRLGHEPNSNGGEINLMCNIFSPQGIYHRTAGGMPIQPGDRFEDGFDSGDGMLRYEYQDGITWTLNAPDFQGHLKVDSFIPPINGFVRDGAKVDSFHRHHVDAACGVTGTLTVKGKTYHVNGLGVRDHGWGARAWGGYLAHRWTLGVFDRDTSFTAVTRLTGDDPIVRTGWIIRGDTAIYADAVEIDSIITSDGASNRGGTVRMTLPTGEHFEARFQPLAPCLASWVHGVISFDTMSRVHWGNRTGFGIFETTANLQAGTRKPKVLDGAIYEDGWYPGVNGCI
jgi:hypothetical protein